MPKTTTKSKTKKRSVKSKVAKAKTTSGGLNLQRYNRLSPRRLAVVIGIFVVIGVALLIRTFAYVPTTVVPAKSLQYYQTANTNPLGVQTGLVVLWSNSTGTGTVNLPTKATALSVSASSTVCVGVGSRMNVSIDGVQVMSTVVSSPKLRAYRVATPIKQGSHRIKVSFTNDYYKAGICDRNLSLDKFTFERVAATNTTSPTPVSTVPVPPTPAPVSTVPTSPTPTPVGTSSNQMALLTNLLGNDMKLPSEMTPNFYADWALSPQKRSFPPPADFSAYIPWGVLSDGSTGNPQPNAKVQIRELDTWLYSKSAKKWVKGQSTTGLLNGAFYKSDWSNNSQPSNAVQYEAGTLVGGIPTGYDYHFYATARGTMNPADIGAIVVTLHARLQPGTYDIAKPMPNYTLCTSVDWWRSQDAMWKSDFSNNRDGGIGRFKKVDKDWRLFTFSNGDLSTVPPITADVSELR